MEEWQAIEDFPDYEVSSLGRVRNAKGRELAPYAAGGEGYRMVALYVNGRRNQRYVHRLVAATFIGPPPEGCNVDHKDGNRGNNPLSNLRYMDESKNFAQGGGRRCRRLHMTDNEKEEVFSLVRAGVPMTRISEKTGRHYRTIRRLVKAAAREGRFANAN